MNTSSRGTLLSSFHAQHMTLSPLSFTHLSASSCMRSGFGTSLPLVTPATMATTWGSSSAMRPACMAREAGTRPRLEESARPDTPSSAVTSWTCSCQRMNTSAVRPVSTSRPTAGCQAPTAREPPAAAAGRPTCSPMVRRTMARGLLRTSARNSNPTTSAPRTDAAIHSTAWCRKSSSWMGSPLSSSSPCSRPRSAPGGGRGQLPGSFMCSGVISSRNRVFRFR
mmetsp:Transcript_21621/g.47307  ORF Transcript_21621/g.47307 Transcript_21621/m.47307 type:complete len:224 (-) Transcript_21621:210-881(-)